LLKPACRRKWVILIFAAIYILVCMLNSYHANATNQTPQLPQTHQTSVMVLFYPPPEMTLKDDPNNNYLVFASVGSFKLAKEIKGNISLTTETQNQVESTLSGDAGFKEIQPITGTILKNLSDKNNGYWIWTVTPIIEGKHNLSLFVSYINSFNNSSTGQLVHHNISFATLYSACSALTLHRFL